MIRRAQSHRYLIVGALKNSKGLGLIEVLGITAVSSMLALGAMSVLQFREKSMNTELLSNTKRQLIEQLQLAAQDPVGLQVIANHSYNSATGFKECMFPTAGSTCNTTASTPLTLTARDGSILALGSLPAYYDARGNVCNPSTCDEAFAVTGSYSATCPGGAPTCNKPSSVKTKFQITAIPIPRMTAVALKDYSSGDLDTEKRGTPYYVPKWASTSSNILADSGFVYGTGANASNLGIGTTAPSALLQVVQKENIPNKGLNLIGKTTDYDVSWAVVSRGGDSWWFNSAGSDSATGLGAGFHIGNNSSGASFSGGPAIQLFDNDQVQFGPSASPNFIARRGELQPGYTWLGTYDIANQLVAGIEMSSATMSLPSTRINKINPTSPSALNMIIYSKGDFIHYTDRDLYFGAGGFTQIASDNDVDFVSNSSGALTTSGISLIGSQGVTMQSNSDLSLVGVSGIGITSQSLTIEGIGRLAFGSASGSFNATSSANLFVTSSADINISADNLIKLGASGWVLRTATGSATADGSGFKVASDRALKEDIERLDEGLPLILSLRPVSYVMNTDNNGRHQMGFIAQEVAAVQKDLVDSRASSKHASDSRSPAQRDEGEQRDMLSVFYLDLIAPLVSAVQSLHEMIANDSEIARLEQKVRLQSKLISQLEQLALKRSLERNQALEETAGSL